MIPGIVAAQQIILGLALNVTIGSKTGAGGTITGFNNNCFTVVGWTGVTGSVSPTDVGGQTLRMVALSYANFTGPEWYAYICFDGNIVGAAPFTAVAFNGNAPLSVANAENSGGANGLYNSQDDFTQWFWKIGATSTNPYPGWTAGQVRPVVFT